MSADINLEWGQSDNLNNLSLVEAVATEERKNELSVDSLSPEDRKTALEFAKKINISDMNAISSYGAESQNKIAAFSDSVLKSVRTKDTGEPGKALVSLVAEIKGFDSAASEKPGFLGGIFGNTKKQIDRLSAGYAKVETNVDKIASALESHRRGLLKDVAMFDEMYQSNYDYYRELTMYIVAGKQKLAEINDVVIPQLRAKADETRNELDAQKLSDMVSAANRFEKKLHDLSLSRMVSIQMAPQIRLMQSNNIQLIDKIQSSIVNAIPLWKNQIVISLGIAGAKSALEAQRKVTDMTNELLRKNAEALKQGTLEIAEENEKGLISIETLQKTNRDLIDTIAGVIEIQKKGHESRIEAEAQLASMESEFKAALLTAAK